MKDFFPEAANLLFFHAVKKWKNCFFIRKKKKKKVHRKKRCCNNSTIKSCTFSVFHSGKKNSILFWIVWKRGEFWHFLLSVLRYKMNGKYGIQTVPSECNLKTGVKVVPEIPKNGFIFNSRKYSGLKSSPPSNPELNLNASC